MKTIEINLTEAQWQAVETQCWNSRSPVDEVIGELIDKNLSVEIIYSPQGGTLEHVTARDGYRCPPSSSLP